MLSGLSVSLPGSEVQKLCLSRAAERRTRAALYDQQIQTLKDADQDLGSSNDVKMRAVEGARTCRQEAETMEFYAKWVDVKETFVLAQYDLQRLGVVK